jgi:lysophospholipase L1-like esterase
MNRDGRGTAEPVSVRLALLGDSVAFGQGAARQADRPASRLTRSLTARGVDVSVGVFAVSGTRSTGLAAQVDQAVRWLPDVAVIVVGANDLTHRVPPDEAARDLGAAVQRLREAGAQVVVAPAPDLSIIPQVPPSARALVAAASAALRTLQVDVVRAAGGLVADEDGATSTAFAADRSLFSGDAFHPSSAGYAVITDALLPEVLVAVERARRTLGCTSAPDG